MPVIHVPFNYEAIFLTESEADIAYSSGRVDTVTTVKDGVTSVATFNYDINETLLSITTVRAGHTRTDTLNYDINGTLIWVTSVVA